MKRLIGRLLGVLVLGVLSLGWVMWVFGPYELVDLDTRFNTARIGADPDAFLAQSEDPIGDVLPHARKRIHWAGEVGKKTPLSIVYLHGFSASAEEIRPVPDRVAQALGANLYFARFTGHGRANPDALAEGSVDGWLRDTQEALEIGRRIGQRVIVIANSTGGTLAALTLTQRYLRDEVDGVAFLSPNFGINNPAAPFLTIPAARLILPHVFGPRRSWEPRKTGQRMYWTTDYPSVAVLPVAAAVKAAQQLDYSTVNIPALFYFSAADTVVDARETELILQRWGGPVTVQRVTLNSGGDDPDSHVLSGQVMSPGNTDATISAILDWIKEL